MDALEPSADAGDYLRQLEAVCVNATGSLFSMDARQHCTYMNPAAEMNLPRFGGHEVYAV